MTAYIGTHQVLCDSLKDENGSAQKASCSEVWTLNLYAAATVDP